MNMNHLLLPMLIFFAIELVAYAQGQSAFVTIAAAGAMACWGMRLGSRAWERAKRKRGGKGSPPLMGRV